MEFFPAHAIGVDLDPTMLAAARSRFPNIDVRAADAIDLPLGDGQAHGYRADKVYHMLPEPSAALTEARRVLAPAAASRCWAKTGTPRSSTLTNPT